MATIVLGCDRNDSCGGCKDKIYRSNVAKNLRKAGHKVEELAIDPNAFASYSYAEKGENPKGKIGVYLMADSITSIADYFDGSTKFKYAYFGIRGDLGLPRMSTFEHFKNNPIRKDRHGDCTPPSCNTLAGKSYVQMNSIVKKKCTIVFGRNAEEMANQILKAMGGESITDDTGDNLTGVDSKDQEARKHY